MKRLSFSISILLAMWLVATGQSARNTMQGEVSYVSSQHIYVKFPNVSSIQPGDTIFSNTTGERIPVLRATSISFISCICEPIGAYAPTVGDQVIFDIKQSDGQNTSHGKNARTAQRDVSQAEAHQINGAPNKKEEEEGGRVGGVQGKKSEAERRSRKVNQSKIQKYKPAFRGKIGVNAYSAFSDQQDRNFLRMRYRLSLNAKHIGGSGISADTYLTFNHRNGEWDQVQFNLFNGLKVYNLNVRYRATPSTELLLGRAINSNIANIGAIDGLQARQNIGQFTIGGIAGSRPDFEDYGFNAQLLQYGGYINHATKLNERPISNSVAVIEQKNNGNTDRRFLYFQHSNALIRDLYLFSSFDVNLFEVRDSIAKNTFGLTSLYVLLRYNIQKDLSVTASYDLRNNVIYYETYRNYLDKLIEEETRQGFSASLRYSIFDFMTIGLRGSYRYRKDDPSPAGNYSGYLYFNQLPAEGLRVHVTTNLIRTAYLSGTMHGVRLNQQLVAGKLSGGIQYRIFEGHYAASETRTLHHIIELQMQWNVFRKLSMAASYEAMLENGSLNNRLYLIASQRF